MTELSQFRVVLDTNVIIAALLSPNPRSPNLELLQRWRKGEFVLLYCPDLLLEYREKLGTKKVPANRAAWFLQGIAQRGVLISLASDEIIPRIPADPDDDVVLACALVGGATHLVSYDPHLLNLQEAYQAEVAILDGLQFLYALRGDVPPSP
jgi:putative PIN family toxin of toxin-antitoxin system